MKHLEIKELISAVPVAVIVKMTRREKLQHWSTLIRQTKVSVRLLHQLEYIHPRELERLTIREHAWQSALGIAASDPVFQAQGLSAATTLGEALRFFEMTVRQAHAFSCDCGGEITNDQQATRIEQLA
jgi:hypothetical protein